MSSTPSAVASAAKSVGDKVAAAAKPSGRPSLKNLSRARVPRAGLISVGLAVVSAVAWQVLVSNHRKRDITEFYKHYDPERDYARMKAAGVFKSLEGRERPEWLGEYESELDQAIASLRGASGKE